MSSFLPFTHMDIGCSVNSKDEESDNDDTPKMKYQKMTVPQLKKVLKEKSLASCMYN